MSTYYISFQNKKGSFQNKTDRFVFFQIEFTSKYRLTFIQQFELRLLKIELSHCKQLEMILVTVRNHST